MTKRLSNLASLSPAMFAKSLLLLVLLSVPVLCSASLFSAQSGATVKNDSTTSPQGPSTLEVRGLRLVDDNGELVGSLQTSAGAPRFWIGTEDMGYFEVFQNASGLLAWRVVTPQEEGLLVGSLVRHSDEQISALLALQDSTGKLRVGLFGREDEDRGGNLTLWSRFGNISASIDADDFGRGQIASFNRSGEVNFLRAR